MMALFVGIVGALGGFCGAVLLSTLLSHPAGATALPAAGAELRLPPAHPTRTVAATVSALGSVTPQPLADVTALVPTAPVVTPVARVLSTGPADLHLTQPLRQVVAPVVPALLPLGTPVVPTLVAAVGAVDGLGSAPGAHSDPRSGPEPGSAPVASHVAALIAVPAFTPRPAVPMNPPAPNGPAPQIPVIPSGTSTAASLPLSGSGSLLAGLPPLGLLMPAPIIASLIFVRRRRPELLLDPRYSPPG